uniref:Uncharacterized protein n=1 Tax=Meloidogyne incognita TaxID=6306 RepID=A0A914KXQ4_MELIC
MEFTTSLALLDRIKSDDKAILQANSGHLINALDSLLEAIQNKNKKYFNATQKG